MQVLYISYPTLHAFGGIRRLLDELLRCFPTGIEVRMVGI